MRVLFVCTGNSCRSVMAAAVMRHILETANVHTIQIESAGVFAIEGMRATQETVRVLQEIGIVCGEHRARRTTEVMMNKADLVFVMERFQGEELANSFPNAASKVHLLKTYGLAPHEVEGDPNIADPIAKPLEVYEVCLSQIRTAVERVCRHLGVRNA